MVFGQQTNTGFIFGSAPLCLILGKDGNLYGTLSFPSYQAPVQENGFNLFRMTTDGNYTFLYADTNNYVRRAFSLVADNQGDFYSVDLQTNAVGSLVGGIEKITPDYQETQLVPSGPGGYDNDELIIGNDGNIYGTTFSATSYQDGTVFRMTPDGVITDLANVAYANGIIQASDGNFYGTTFSTTWPSPGTVFKMTPSGNLTTIVTLPINTHNGWPGTFEEFSMPDLLQGSDGNLYGLTQVGGAYDQGMIYRVNFVPTLAAISAPVQNTNTFILSWNALPGQTCQMQYKTNLTQSAWVNLGSPVTTSNAFSIVTDTIGQDPQRFYRVMLIQ